LPLFPGWLCSPLRAGKGDRNIKRTKTQITFFFIALLSVGLALLVNYRNFEQKRDAYYARLQDELSVAYGVIVLGNQEDARIVFDTFINKPEILELYKQAASADEARRAFARRQLLEKLGPLYERLKMRYVRQFHFHLPNSESFLRFHRPEKYGDSLKGVRYSVDKANAEQVAVRGFEEGRIVNGFRNVFPLIHQGEHLGSVEISMCFDDIRKKMEQQFHSRYAFAVRRRLVEKKVFKDEQKNYQPSDFSDAYLYEQGYAADDALKAVNAILKPKIQERLHSGEPFAIEAMASAAPFITVFHPVKNVEGKQAAYIVSYNEDNTIRGYYKEFIVTLAASIAGILAIVLLMYLLINALRRLRAEKKKLQQERDIFIGSSALVFKWQNREKWPVEYVSANIHEMLGYTAADFMQGKVLYADIIHPEDRKRVIEEIETHSQSRTERFEHEPYRLIHANKEVIWVQGYTTIARDEAGAITHFLGYLADITDRKRVEEVLQRREKFLQDMFDAIQDGISVLDTDLNIIKTNCWMEQAYARQMPLAGKKCYQAYQMRQSPCPWCPGLSSMETGEPHSAIVPYPSEDDPAGWIELFTFPMKDEQGRVTGVIEYVKDITERKRAEEQLHNEREKLFVTLRSVGDGVITADTEGRVTFINRVAEQLTGMRQEEAIGRPLAKVFNIINEKTGLPADNPMNKVLDSGLIIGLANHTALIARDGTRRSIADSGAPIRDAKGNIIGVVLVFRDVTELKRREKELLKIKKLESVGVLAGGIAHDFNNILTAILGNISLAGVYVEKDHKAHHLLTEAEKASIRAKDLTQQLLTFSKGGDPVKETASIKKVITDSADFVLHGGNVACRYAIADDLWLVDIDKGQMSQVIQNIVINARQAMPEGGSIAISCENIADAAEETVLSLPHGKYIKITIADNGYGIPEKYLDKIFDPYFTTKQEGSGLGLALTHSIITKHEGHIAVRSKMAEGTAFTIYLPASTQQISGDSEEETQKPENAVSATILVMDDEQLIQDVAEQMLSRFGHKVLQAKDGKEAIAIFKEHQHSDNPVDVIIMDLTIPGGMGGKDAIQKILKIDPDARAIVSSGYANDSVMANYRKYGFKAAIGKPFKMAELKKTVNSVLG
jgi:PAS domain S-box-containing protein